MVSKNKLSIAKFFHEEVIKSVLLHILDTSTPVSGGMILHPAYVKDIKENHTNMGLCTQ